MALSKDWLLKDALGILRVLSNQIAPDRIQDLFLIDSLHMAVSEVSTLLSGAKNFDYGQEQVLSVTDYAASIASYNLQSIIKIVDATNGLVVPQSLQQLEGLKDIPQKQANVYYTRHGDTIYFYKGSGVSALGTITLYYNRFPIKATALSSYLDIKDMFVDLVLRKVKLSMYEILQKTPPESLQNNVNQAIQKIAVMNIKNKEAQNNPQMQKRRG
jgi:hypothetical protein